MINGTDYAMTGYSSGVKMKVRFFSPVCNNPEFIKLQKDTLGKFIQDDYEYIVLNDGLTPELVKEISEICETNGIECIEVPKTLIHSSAAVAHCSVMQWAYDNGEVNTDDPDDFFDWLSRDLEDIVKGKIKVAILLGL